jgi:hypothetical protein
MLMKSFQILTVKGCFAAASETAVVDCTKAYVEKHMHHNLPDVSFSIHTVQPFD